MRLNVAQRIAVMVVATAIGAYQIAALTRSLRSVGWVLTLDVAIVLVALAWKSNEPAHQAPAVGATAWWRTIRLNWLQRIVLAVGAGLIGLVEFAAIDKRASDSLNVVLAFGSIGLLALAAFSSKGSARGGQTTPVVPLPIPGGESVGPNSEAVAAGISKENVKAVAELLSKVAVTQAIRMSVGREQKVSVRQAAAMMNFGRLRMFGPEGEIAADAVRAKLQQHLEPGSDALLTERGGNVGPRQMRLEDRAELLRLLGGVDQFDENVSDEEKNAAMCRAFHKARVIGGPDQWDPNVSDEEKDAALRKAAEAVKARNPLPASPVAAAPAPVPVVSENAVTKMPISTSTAAKTPSEKPRLSGKCMVEGVDLMDPRVSTLDAESAIKRSAQKLGLIAPDPNVSGADTEAAMRRPPPVFLLAAADLGVPLVGGSARTVAEGSQADLGKVAETIFQEDGPQPDQKTGLPTTFDIVSQTPATEGPVEPVNALLDSAVIADPDRIGVWLVYADWLEERGDPRAELVRLQCKSPGDSEGAWKIITANWPRWFGSVRQGPLECKWDRGFVSEVSIQPLEGDPSTCLALLARPSMKFLRKLTLPLPDAADDLLDVLGRLPLLRELRLDNRYKKKGAMTQVLEGLVRAPWLNQLRALELKSLSPADVILLLTRRECFLRLGARLEIGCSEEAIAVHRAALRAAFPAARLFAVPWTFPGFRYSAGGPHTHPTPRYAPANFRQLPKWQQQPSADGLHAVSLGSGVPFTAGSHRFSRCVACASTDTLCIFERVREFHYERAGGGFTECEYLCLECGAFSSYETNRESQ